MRNLSPVFQQVIDSHEIAPVMLIHLDMLPIPVRVWTGVGDIQYMGETWIGAAHVGSIEPIKESATIKAESVRLTLNCVPDIDLSELKNEEYKGRQAEIYYCLMEESCNEVIASDLGFCGEMDAMRLKYGDRGRSIEITVVNDLVRLKKSWALMHTDSDQRRLHPDDTSHRFIHAIQDLSLKV